MIKPGANVWVTKRVLLLALLAYWSYIPVVVNAEDSQAELTKKLSNPIASLISVPMQLNLDQDIGANDQGERYVLNIQPVIPISLNENWNVISRTILPFIDQDDIVPGTDQRTD